MNAKPLCPNGTRARAIPAKAPELVVIEKDACLSKDEREELNECEKVISRHLGAFFEIGMALLKVCQKRLYREQYHSFDQYCREKWEISRMHAYRLVHAAEVHKALSPIGDIPLPANEAQIRPLTSLPLEEAQRAWKLVVKKAGKSKITAQFVAEVVGRAGKEPRSARPNFDLLQWQRDAQDMLGRVSDAIAQSEFELAIQGLDQVRLRVDLERERFMRETERMSIV